MATPYQEGEQASSAKRNATSVLSNTGAVLSATPATQLIPIVRCTETSGGLKKDELYFRSADLLSWINVRRKHLHNSALDEDGGLHHEIKLANPKEISFGKGPSNHIDDFVITSSGDAGAVYYVDPTYGKTVVLTSTWNSGSSVGNYVNASVQGRPVSFTEKIVAYVMTQLNFNANQVARIGWGMEESQNTVDLTRKLGMEMCSSTGTNWQIVTANGLTRTISASSMNASPVPLSPVTYCFYYNPYTAEFKVKSSKGVSKLVTSTIPSGGQIDNVRVFRIGIDTTNATSKTLWINHAMGDYITADST